MSKVPDVPMTGALEAIRLASTPAERAKLQAYAMELITEDGYPAPVPRFMLELPKSGDELETQLRIASAILVADDPDATQEQSGTDAAKELTGKQITVWDIRVAPSGIDARLGAYLLFDYTVGDDEVHKVGNTGALQAIVRLARAWVDDELPVTGSFSAVPGTGAKGNPVITFLAEKAFS